MSLSGLSAREAEASIQKYGLNEQTNEISFADYFIGGLTSLSCKLFVIAAMLKLIMLLLGLLEIIPSCSDAADILVLAGLALLCAALEAAVRYTSDKRYYKICTCARQSMYTVLRGGKPERIGENLLAVGDVIYLSAGDIVPADGIVADGRFIVDQSEYGSLEKTEKTTPPSSFHGNRAMGLKSAYSLYRGMVITDGSGAMKVTATGDNVFASGKSKDISHIHGDKFGSLIRIGGIIGAVCAGGILIFCIVYGAISGKLLTGLLEGMSATAVLLSVTCLCGKNLIIEFAASGAMKKLDNQGVKVSNPDILNDMSNMNVVFIDKTGSYTDGNYIVSGFIDGTGNQIDKLEDINEKIVVLIKTAAVNTSTAYLDGDNTVYGGTAADRAILEFIKKSSGKAKVKKQTCLRKGGVSGVTVNIDGKTATFMSGNAELIINRCSDSFSADGKKKKITNKDALIKLAATISLTGNDVVALAVCDRSLKEEKLPNGGCTLIGMIVLHDKMYDNIADDLNNLEKRGIKTILMTSASRETVIYTLKKSGKKSKGVILSSEQLAKMNDKELAKRFSDIRAVVSADASDKLRVIHTASEQSLRSCAVGADAVNMHILDETDTAIASSVCPSAIRSNSDASSEVSGLTAAALLCSMAERLGKMCRICITARITCTVILAAITVISIIGW